MPFTDIPSGYKVRFQMREVPSHVYNAKMIGDYLRDQTSQDSERGPRNHKSLFKSILKRIKTDRN